MTICTHIQSCQLHSGMRLDLDRSYNFNGNKSERNRLIRDGNAVNAVATYRVYNFFSNSK